MTGVLIKNVQDNTGQWSCLSRQMEGTFPEFYGSFYRRLAARAGLNVFIEENIDTLICELDQPFSQCELTAAVKVEKITSHHLLIIFQMKC